MGVRWDLLLLCNQPLLWEGVLENNRGRIRIGCSVGVFLAGWNYKENTSSQRFLQNLLEKSISFLFIVEVDNGGGRLEVFFDVLQTHKNGLVNILI